MSNIWQFVWEKRWVAEAVLWNGNSILRARYFQLLAINIEC